MRLKTAYCCLLLIIVFFSSTGFNLCVCVLMCVCVCVCVTDRRGSMERLGPDGVDLGVLLSELVLITEICI